MTHICVSELATIGSNNGLSPGRYQVIIWNSAEKLLIGTLGTNFSEILAHLPLVPHICVSELACLLLIALLGTNFRHSNRNSINFIQEHAFEIVVWQNGGHFVQGGDELSEIHTIPFKKTHLEMSPVKCHPFCSGRTNSWSWCRVWSVECPVPWKLSITTT